MTRPAHVDEAEERRLIERWFVRQGLPHAIDDYRASTDVFTRATPFLSVVFLLEASFAFGDRFTGWAQFGVVVLAIGVLFAVVALVNRLRGRRPFARPRDIGPIELALFVLGPAILPVIFSTERTVGFFGVIVLNILVLGLTYVVVSFGLLPMARSGASHVLREVGGLGRLMLRSLPLLLLFATFLFLNAEMWQVAHEFTPAFYAIAVGILVAIAFVFLALRIPVETTNLSGFDSWAEICERSVRCSAPVSDRPRPHLVDPPRVEPLARIDRVNIGVLMFMRQAVQVILVAGVIGVFYVIFGLFTVRRETLLQWTTIEDEGLGIDPIWEATLFGGELILSWELIAVSGFIAAFSALQFSVSLLTDSTYREEFFADTANEVRDVLAVRALYLHDLRRSE